MSSLIAVHKTGILSAAEKSFVDRHPQTMVCKVCSESLVALLEPIDASTINVNIIFFYF